MGRKPATEDARLLVECSKCGSRQGERCRNYKKQNKPTCAARGRLEGVKRDDKPTERPGPTIVQADLFGGGVGEGE